MGARAGSLLLAGVRLDDNCELSCSIKTHYWLLLASAVFSVALRLGTRSMASSRTVTIQLLEPTWQMLSGGTGSFFDHFHTIHPSDTL